MTEDPGVSRLPLLRCPLPSQGLLPPSGKEAQRSRRPGLKVCDVVFISIVTTPSRVNGPLVTRSGSHGDAFALVSEGGSARRRGQHPWDPAEFPHRARSSARGQPDAGARARGAWEGARLLGPRGEKARGWWAENVLKFSIPGAEGTREANKGSV